MKLRLFVIALAVCMLVSVVSQATAGQVIFSRPYDQNGSPAYWSQYNNGTAEYFSFSDYYYSGAYDITDFHWWGFEADNRESDLMGFYFVIYNPDNFDSHPGTIAYWEYVNLADASPVLTGDQWGGIWDIYKYSIDLATPFHGATGNYWFSVIGDLYGQQSGIWHWAPGFGRHLGNDLQYQWQQAEWVETDNADFAFEVTGVVPEPVTLTLFSLGLLGTGLAARRRK